MYVFTRNKIHDPGNLDETKGVKLLHFTGYSYNELVNQLKNFRIRKCSSLGH